jgi:hypothetical protein
MATKIDNTKVYELAAQVAGNGGTMAEAAEATGMSVARLTNVLYEAAVSGKAPLVFGKKTRKQPVREVKNGVSPVRKNRNGETIIGAIGGGGHLVEALGAESGDTVEFEVRSGLLVGTLRKTVGK